MTEPTHSIISAEERAAKIREESAQREAEQAKQEQFQRDRQAAHRQEALRIQEENLTTMTALATDDVTRANLHALILKMREDAKPKPEPAPLGIRTPRQQEQYELEIAAGRRTLAKHAEQARIAAEARAKISPEEKAREEEARRKREGYMTPVYTDRSFVPGFKV